MCEYAGAFVVSDCFCVSVKRLATKSFASIGWDTRSNRSISPAPPTAAAVRDMLHGLSEVGAAHLLLIVCLTVVSQSMSQYKPNTTPTADELSDLSAACNRLWQLDVNRLTPGVE